MIDILIVESAGCIEKAFENTTLFPNAAQFGLYNPVASKCAAAYSLILVWITAEVMDGGQIL